MYSQLGKQIGSYATYVIDHIVHHKQFTASILRLFQGMRLSNSRFNEKHLVSNIINNGKLVIFYPCHFYHLKIIFCM